MNAINGYQRFRTPPQAGRNVETAEKTARKYLGHVVNVLTLK